MFLLRLLSFLDLITVFAITFAYLDLLPLVVIVWVPVYLVFKGMIFFGDIASILDMVCGLIVALFFMGFKPAFLFIAVILYLLQKIVVAYAAG